MSSEGLLISFDGLDASGKETQSRLFAERLVKGGFVVHQLQTPDYTTPSGEELKLRLQGKIGNWEQTPWEEKVMYFARNRAENKDKVEEALSRGEIVIYDRYIPSSLTFMTVEAGVGEREDAPTREDVYAKVLKIEHEENKMPLQHLSVFCDVPARITTSLLNKRKSELRDQDEYTDLLHVQERLYAEYKRLFATDPKQYVMIECMDGEMLLPIEDIHARVWEGVTGVFPQLKQ